MSNNWQLPGVAGAAPGLFACWRAQLAECVEENAGNETGYVAVVLVPSTSTTAKVGRHPQICHPDRSGGICSFIFGHSESAVGESPPGSVFSINANCRSLHYPGFPAELGGIKEPPS
jgi:hypothetical protein